MMWTQVAGAILATLPVGPTRGASPADPSKYEVLAGEDLAGSGFVIRYRDQLWGVTSIHQFDGKTPSRLERFEMNGESLTILLQPKGARRQHDVQAIPVADQNASVPFLAYDPGVALAAGEALLILSLADGVVPATLDGPGGYRCADGPDSLMASAERPFMASGGSGSPILRKSTGTVVGVLLNADDGQKARRIGFETLCLDAAHETRMGGGPIFAAAVFITRAACVSCCVGLIALIVFLIRRSRRRAAGPPA
jgi:hypothetical protein